MDIVWYQISIMLIWRMSIDRPKTTLMAFNLVTTILSQSTYRHLGCTVSFRTPSRRPASQTQEAGI